MIRRLVPAGVLACAALAACSQKDGQADDATTQAASAAPAPPAAFAVCASCHPVSPGRHGAGPSLARVWGRKAASASGYAYSPALEGSGIVWNAQTLDRWLQGPMRMVPGTRMVVGLSDPEARQAVIAYVQQLK